jgi:hypothetical protein
VDDVPPELRNEIEQVYKDLEVGKGETVTHGFGDRADAERVVGEARARAAET